MNCNYYYHYYSYNLLFNCVMHSIKNKGGGNKRLYVTQLEIKVNKRIVSAFDDVGNGDYKDEAKQQNVKRAV